MGDSHDRDSDALRILVAEDEPHIQRILVTLFESAGHHTVIMSDGPATLEAVRSDTRFDVAILDLVMPGASGLDVLRELRGLEHRSKLPVIMLTAKGQDADRERALSLGADAFMTKPFSPRKLLGRIDALTNAG